MGGIEATEAADREFLMEGLELLQKILNEQTGKVMIVIRSAQMAEFTDIEAIVAYGNAMLLE